MNSGTVQSVHKLSIAALVVAGVFLLLGAIYVQRQNATHIGSFEACAKAGNPVMESYPARCRTKDGRLFVQDISDEDRTKLIPPTFGTLEGEVEIGPICPVEREGIPCSVPPEAYTSRQIVIYEEDGVSEIVRMQLTADGTYKLSLPAGSYMLSIAQNGIDRSPELPVAIKILEGATTVFNFSIDTGIR